MGCPLKHSKWFWPNRLNDAKLIPFYILLRTIKFSYIFMSCIFRAFVTVHRGEINLAIDNASFLPHFRLIVVAWDRYNLTNFPFQLFPPNKDDSKIRYFESICVYYRDNFKINKNVSANYPLIAKVILITLVRILL